MMDVEQEGQRLNIAQVLNAMLSELSILTDYHMLRDNIPRLLAQRLHCQYSVLYLRMGESLQIASSSFTEMPGALPQNNLGKANTMKSGEECYNQGSFIDPLAGYCTREGADGSSPVYNNPISLNSDLPEARAWRARHTIGVPTRRPSLLAVPLFYRQQAIGVLVAMHEQTADLPQPSDCWQDDEISLLEAIAGIVALLLENARLLEHDRERIHELSLLNSLSSQLNSSMHEMERLRGIIIQRTKEIAEVDLCALLLSSTPVDDVTWVPASLREHLFQRFHTQHSLAPLVIERTIADTDLSLAAYLKQLPDKIQTFFVLPLLSGRAVNSLGGTVARGNLTVIPDTATQILGIIVGAYQRPHTLRPSESTLLQVLASQASTVLENILLMADVVEARNEARMLLRQVLNDQRLKDLVLESVPSGLITSDLQGRIQTFNRAAEAILGYHPYEVLGQSLHKFLDLRSAFSALPYAQATQSATQPSDLLYTSIYTGESQRNTVVTTDRYEHALVLDVDIQPLCDDLGERIGMLATFTDMTSMHHLEEEKRRLDRLASLGEMAANVAHEVRNPLASIKTSIQMVWDDLTQDASRPSPSDDTNGSQADWVQESLAIVLKEVERLDTIVRDLLLFARPRQLHRTSCNVVELMQQILKLIQAQCADAGVVIHPVYEEVPISWLDRDQIEQVILNLCMNALQAMPEGGILSVSCRCIPADSPLSERRRDGASSNRGTRASKNVPQQWLEVVVSDTGIGIPGDQLEQIFRPFYSTRAHGIGLGLAITRRLIEDHGGCIQVESRFGYGTTLLVRLPVVIQNPLF